MQQVTDRPMRLRDAAFALAFWSAALGSAGAGAQERVARPAPVPSPSIVGPGSLEASQLPAGADTGIPGTGQKPGLTGNVKGDNTPRKLAQRRGAEPAASAARVDDRAAARAAGRGASTPAVAASAAR